MLFLQALLACLLLVARVAFKSMMRLCGGLGKCLDGHFDFVVLHITSKYFVFTQIMKL